MPYLAILMFNIGPKGPFLLLCLIGIFASLACVIINKDTTNVKLDEI